MDEPLVSIITICKNSEKTIEKTIKSIIVQSYKKIEYIVIDGKSTDSTLEIIKSYTNEFSNSNIKFKVISENDKGISDAFNKGLTMVTGDIIAFLNSDDWYTYNVIEIVVNALCKFKKDYYYGNIYMHKKNSNSENDIKILIGKEFSNQAIKYTMPINHPTLFITKNIVSAIGLFSLNYKFAMDYDYVLRIHSNGFIGVYLPDLFVNMSDGGTHRSNYFKTLKEVYRIAVSHGANSRLAILALIYTYVNQRLVKIPIIHLLRRTSNLICRIIQRK